tara:strand:- start:1609 stop:1887 length:279 start_codon:yes stop_codon:yes gene_type:complete
MYPKYPKPAKIRVDKNGPVGTLLTRSLVPNNGSLAKIKGISPNKMGYTRGELKIVSLSNGVEFMTTCTIIARVINNAVLNPRIIISICRENI